jgi:adenylate kinase
LKDNRLDDVNDSVIEKRLDIYEEETQPVLEYYGAAKVIKINATQSPAQVLYEILGAITASESKSANGEEKA